MAGGHMIDLSKRLDARSHDLIAHAPASDHRSTFDAVTEDAVISFIFFVEVVWIVQLWRWGTALVKTLAN